MLVAEKQKFKSSSNRRGSSAMVGYFEQPNTYLYEMSNPIVGLDPLGEADQNAPATAPATQASGQVTVYIWPSHSPPLPGTTGVGHVAMAVPNGKTPTYISWFPSKPPGISKVPIQATNSRSLDLDTKDEKCQPDVYTVTGVNTDDINKWWIQYQKDQTVWFCLGPNCATTVEDGLKAGGLKGLPKANLVSPKALEPVLQQIPGVTAVPPTPAATQPAVAQPAAPNTPTTRPSH